MQNHNSLNPKFKINWIASNLSNANSPCKKKLKSQVYANCIMICMDSMSPAVANSIKLVVCCIQDHNC